MLLVTQYKPIFELLRLYNLDILSPYAEIDEGNLHQGVQWSITRSGYQCEENTKERGKISTEILINAPRFLSIEPYPATTTGVARGSPGKYPTSNKNDLSIIRTALCQFARYAPEKRGFIRCAKSIAIPSRGGISLYDTSKGFSEWPEQLLAVCLVLRFRVK